MIFEDYFHHPKSLDVLSNPLYMLWCFLFIGKAGWGFRRKNKTIWTIWVNCFCSFRGAVFECHFGASLGQCFRTVMQLFWPVYQAWLGSKHLWILSFWPIFDQILLPNILFDFPPTSVLRTNHLCASFEGAINHVLKFVRDGNAAHNVVQSKLVQT